MSSARSPLPESLPALFSTVSARDRGVAPSRLRAADLIAPRRGVRLRDDPITSVEQSSRFERHRRAELERIRAVALVSTPTQFFSHRSAALLWGAPVPHRPGAPVHLSVLLPRRSPRADGVVGHNLSARLCSVTELDGLRLTAPAVAWAQLGTLSVPELVAVGDFLVRKYRDGHGRRDAGRPPLAAMTELADALAQGRRFGAARLRAALGLIREDSWSPQESLVRVEIVRSGLPEPELNGDVFDDAGRFLGCLDMRYPRYRVGIEYQGEQHEGRYADDVERLAALRAAGWNIVEVTRSLRRRPGELVSRVRAALEERGWRDPRSA
ncbi:hypothetical protein MUN78_05410 [Leucobacter allii]|uniref:DUF559 domain-containing protein n=1 Tax=Leucobacter allii TaxID=2932247 RepID=A0ABY4FPT9_9MICO|nr:hypothetical protein [Leucobacter allii]UOQ58282.1 hypothetical protein MUN78_05410 [Leucobacter allii]